MLFWGWIFLLRCARAAEEKTSTVVSQKSQEQPLSQLEFANSSDTYWTVTCIEYQIWVYYTCYLGIYCYLMVERIFQLNTDLRSPENPLCIHSWFAALFTIRLDSGCLIAWACSECNLLLKSLLDLLALKSTESDLICSQKISSAVEDIFNLKKAFRFIQCVWYSHLFNNHAFWYASCFRDCKTGFLRRN